MAKRQRFLIGLWAVVTWNGALTGAFLLPVSTRVRLRLRHSPEQADFTNYDSGAPSTCRLFAAMGDDAGIMEQNGGVAKSRNELADSADDSMKSATANSAGGLIPGDVSLADLLEELDRRDIRYAPTATRSELEQLLQNTQQVPAVPSPLSLQELIEELDRRDIRYPPTSSRKELEILLASADGRQPRKDHGTVVDAGQTRATFYSQGAIPLAEILQELDKRNIRYPPTASRMQLEALLQRATATDDQRPSSTRETFVTLESGSPVKPPAEATRASQRTTRGNTTKPNERTRCQAVSRTDSEARAAPSILDPPIHRMPLNILLEKLDRLNVRYSPTASRAELEELLKQTTQQRAAHEVRRQRRRSERGAGEESSSFKDLLRKSTRVAAKGVQKLPRKVSRIATSPEVTSRISGVADRAARQAKRVKRRASDFWNVDEDGIRDVDFEYVSVDRPIDVRAVRLDEDNDDEPRRGPSRRAPREPQPQRPPRSPQPPEPRKPPQRAKNGRTTAGRPSANWQPEYRVPKQRYRKRPVSRQRVENSLGSSSFILAPASQVPFPDLVNATSTTNTNNGSVSDASKDTGRQRRTRDASRNTSGKKQVYSPYIYDDDGEIEGPFDRIGEFLTNSADRLLWGPDDDDYSFQKREPSVGKQPEKGSSKGQQNERVRNGRRGRFDSEDEKRKRRYWKDRLTEQVDYALGIHEDGEYYNSWEKQLDKEQERREREGTQFWEKSTRSPRNRRSPAKGGVKYSRSFWEEDGNIIAFILGRTKSGDELGVDVSSTCCHVI